MKTTLILLFLFSAGKLFAQTDSIEKRIFKEKLDRQEITLEKYGSVGSKWMKTLQNVGGYPDLPIDANGETHFSLLSRFVGIDKTALFNHSLEWLSLTYGIFPVNLYANAEDGKIVFRNSFSVNVVYTCNYTGIMTVKDEKLLVEFIKIEYQAFYPGHYSGDSWIQDKTITRKIEQLYPVILQNSSDWEESLLILKTTNEQLNNDVVNLYDFIANYRKNNDF